MELLGDALGNHGLFGSESIWFIDRIVPNNLKPWCENWSGRMFELLKKLSQTFILEDGNLNGSAYGFEPQYQADLPDNLDINSYLPPETIMVGVPPQTTGVLTWQEIEGQQEKRFQNDTDQPLIEQFNIANWVASSINFDGIELSQIGNQLTVRISPQSKGILTWREKTNAPRSYCDKLTNSISITHRKGRVFRNSTKEPQIHEISTVCWLHNSVCFDGVELALTGNQAKFLLYDRMEAFLDFLWEELRIPSCKVLTGYSGKKTQTYTGNGGGLILTVSDSTENINPSYSSVPSTYNYAFLFKEGVSKGVLTTNYDNDSGLISFTVNDPYNYFSNGGATFDINSSFLVNSSPTTINASFFSESSPTFGVLLSSFGYLLRHDATGDIFGHYSQNPPTPAPPVYSEQILTSEFRHNIIQRWYTYTGNVGSTTEHIHLWSLVTKNRMVSSNGSVYGFAGNDPNLFNTFEAGFASTALNTVNDSSGKYFSDGVSEFLGQNISRAKQNITSSYRVTLKNNAEELPSVDNTGFSQSYGSISHNFSGDTNVNSTVSITRTIGGNNNPPDLIVFTDGEASIFRGQTAQNLIVDIIYPDGPGQPGILNPDPDNGDIMPDSIRIKEIHAALEADRYGVHPGNPDKKRFNNLGRYLETLAYATGIAFNEDGKNIPQPESNWVDADYIQTINANQSLRNGQFAVREVNDAYGQRMVCDALFEVRARQITTTTDEQGNLQVASTSPGGAMRVPHIGGIFDTIQDDLTKYWGGGDIMVPKVDGTGIVYYDSMGECLADCLYMLGSHSKSINELQNQSIKSVFLLQEILRALGLPCHVAAVQGVSPSAPGGEGGVMPCPELDEKSPTLASLIGLVLINLSRVVGASIAFREDDSAPPPPPGADPDPGVGGASA